MNAYKALKYRDKCLFSRGLAFIICSFSTSVYFFAFLLYFWMFCNNFPFCYNAVSGVKLCSIVAFEWCISFHFLVFSRSTETVCIFCTLEPSISLFVKNSYFMHKTDYYIVISHKIDIDIISCKSIWCFCGSEIHRFDCFLPQSPHLWNPTGRLPWHGFWIGEPLYYV